MPRIRRAERRRLAKQFAHEAFNESPQDLDKAKEIFTAKAQEVGMDPATILSLLIIAYRFWKYLKENGFLKAPEGSGEELFHEVGSGGDEDDDE
jgi:hypothetical protein